MLDNKPNQAAKFITKNWVEINGDSRGQIKFKTSILRSSWCGYSDVYILVSGTITIIGAGPDDAAEWLDERNKEVIF